jgi:acetyltransferase
MDLQAIFNPESVAVIGASATPNKVGFNCLESIVYGGFQGKIFPVHPRYEEILGLKTYRNILEIEEKIDLAVIALNQYTTTEIIDDCASKGVKGIISIAGGFREVGDEGKELEKRLVEKAKQYGIPLLGPNTLGVINTDVNFYSTFYPMKLKKGGISIITQSGGVGLTILYKLMEEKVGVSKWIGVGNRSVIDFPDVIKYLEKDPSTKVIGIFMEGTERAREFLEIAKKVVLKKPVVVFKVGKSKKVDFSAQTHTGSTVGDYNLYKSAFKQFGIITADSVRELIAKCKALSLQPVPEGDNLGILTISAGPSIVILDMIADVCKMPEFHEKTINKVKERMGENPPLVIKNPLDVAASGFMPDDFRALSEAVIQDPEVNAFLAITIQHRHWRFPTPEIIEVVKNSSIPVVVCYPAEYKVVEKEIEKLAENGIPAYSTPEEAAWGIKGLFEYKHIKERFT